jgi:hypothetical protein
VKEAAVEGEMPPHSEESVLSSEATLLRQAPCSKAKVEEVVPSLQRPNCLLSASVS